MPRAVILSCALTWRALINQYYGESQRFRQHPECQLYENPSPGQSLNIPLVSAPAGTQGISLRRAPGWQASVVWRRRACWHHWRQYEVDSGWFQDGSDKAAAAKANSFMNAGYKNFWRKLTTWTNVWVSCVTRTVIRCLGPYHERCRFSRWRIQWYYTHVQVGFDKKHALDGVDLSPVSRWPIPTAVQTVMRSAGDKIRGGRSVCFSTV